MNTDKYDELIVGSNDLYNKILKEEDIKNESESIKP